MGSDLRLEKCAKVVRATYARNFPRLARNREQGVVWWTGGLGEAVGRASNFVVSPSYTAPETRRVALPRTDSVE